MSENNIQYLRDKLALKQTRNVIRYKYYEQKIYRKKSPIIPPWLDGLYEAVNGWCTKAVDELADRLVFLGFDEKSDIYQSGMIFRANNPDIFFDSAIRESMIASCAFAHISHGDPVKNPDGTITPGIPKLSLLTAKDATGIIDEQTGLLKEGYAVLDRDKNTGLPTLEAYFTAEQTEYRFTDARGTTAVIEPNPCPYPLLVPIMYKPTSSRPFGHSRISRSCMYYQQFATNTLRRAEVSGEFYSFPQKYASGTDPEMDPMDSWRASITSMLRFDKDQDGQAPSIGQFSQQSMTPYTDQIRMAAAMFAGETGLTLDDLGFVSDNPSSSDAIKAAHESLRVIARSAQRKYASAFANIGYVSACVRDNFAYSRALVPEMKAMWEPVFEPDASMVSTIGDAAIKVNQAVPGFFDKANLSELTGIEADKTEEVVEQTEEEAVTE